VMGAARWYFDKYMRSPMRHRALGDGTAA
jgi:hypothetical protein